MSNLQSYFIAGPENLLPNHIYKSEKPNNALVRIVSELAENGLEVFQLRDKSMKDNEIIDLIKDLSVATSNTKMKLCINDNVNVASKCKGLIDILHLGQTDMDPNEAKKLIVRAIRSGIFNDLGSGSNVDLCVITQSGAKEYRNYEEHNVRSSDVRERTSVNDSVELNNANISTSTSVTVPVNTE